MMVPVCLAPCGWTLASWVTPFQPASCQTYVQWFCRLVYICAEELADVYRALADKKVRSCLCSWRLLCWLCTLPPIISVSQQLPCFPPLGLGANMSHFRWPPQAFEKHACWMQQTPVTPSLHACRSALASTVCSGWLTISLRQPHQLLTSHGLRQTQVILSSLLPHCSGREHMPCMAPAAHWR